MQYLIFLFFIISQIFFAQDNILAHENSEQKNADTFVVKKFTLGERKKFDGIDFIFIIPGEFKMGSPFDEVDRSDDEVVHHVKISTGFWMGKYEITQEQWQSIMGDNPSHFKSGSDYPVEKVSWEEVQEFIKKMNKNSETCKRELDSEQVWRESAGGCYRLPTEAEWEYATRAGTSTPFGTGNNISTDQANYDGNYPYDGGKKGTYRKGTTIVNNFSANSWGLHDMHGNVWEWVLDWYDSSYYGKCGSVCTDPANLTKDSYRVVRGGSWNDYGQDLRSAYRDHYSPDSRFSVLGFRLLRVVQR